MPILEYLDRATIDLSIAARSKEEVIGALVEILHRSGKIQATQALTSALLERESLGSTGIGHGVAIPHARSAELTGTVIALGRTAAPIEFDAIDGKPSRLFFLLVAPEKGGNEHLFTLAKIARLIKDPQVRESLMNLESPDAVFDLIHTQDAR